MNKDQLLDAIGMVDEQKIRDAIIMKRTKRISGILTVLTVLTAVVLPLLAVGYFGLFSHKTVIEYTPSQIARDIDNAYAVTVWPDLADRQSHYTIYVPDDTSDAMRFDEWMPADPQAVDGRDTLLSLDFFDVSIVFYDGGYVCAKKHDFDDYTGIYTVPEELWREVLALLAKE